VDEKKSGDPERENELHAKVDFESREVKKTSWSGIELKPTKKANYDEKQVKKTDSVENVIQKMDSDERLTQKQDSDQNVREAESSGLMEPLNQKPVSRSQKYSVEKHTPASFQAKSSVKKHTHKWNASFEANNVLIRTQLLLESGILKTKEPFVNWVCRLVHNLSSDTRIQIKYVPDFPVTIKSKKIFNVDKVVKMLDKERHDEGAKTERQVEKGSEKMSDDIIPDSPTHASSTSADTDIEQIITVRNGLVSQHIPEIKYEDGSKSGPAWWSWME